MNQMKTVESLASHFEPDNLEINNMVMCSKCLGETFESWFYNDVNEESEFEVENILCHKCASKLRRTDKLSCFIKYNEADIRKFMIQLEGLQYKYCKKEKYPLYPKFAANKFYIKTSVSEYFQDIEGKLVPLTTDPNVFDDPINVIKEKFFLSRKSTLSGNIFDKDALMYKIKKKDNKDEMTEKKPPLNELTLIEQKVLKVLPSIMFRSSKNADSEAKVMIHEKIITKTNEFFSKFDDETKLREEVLTELYSNFRNDIKNSSGLIATLRAMLKEDKFINVKLPIEKAYCIFLYLENVFNPEESMFISVTDEEIFDKDLLENLRFIVKCN